MRHQLTYKSAQMYKTDHWNIACLQELLEKLGVRVFYMAEVERRGLADVLKEAQYLVTR